MNLRALLVALALTFGGWAASAAATVPAAVPVYPRAESPEAAVYRGNLVFQHYCILCHGANADGKGRAAKLYQPRPADLVHTDKNAAYIELIIRQGGAALGRSQFMPPWGGELTDEQVSDVVSFIGALRAAASTDR